MIKANELRRNDLVLFAPSGKRHHTIKPRPCKVLEVHEEKVVVEDMGLKLSLFYGTEDLQPIPLTPEILEKCGFVKDRNGWTLPNTDLSLTDNMYPCWLDKMLWPQDVARYREYSLTSLHQLQNLYYALTGTELEINL